MQQIGEVTQFHLLVAGGGTAGWLTANLLNVLLNQPGQERFRITVVESPDTPRIGVGEATIPTLVKTLQQLGIPEGEFLQRTQATFKHAIRFENWRDGGDVYFHTFDAFHQLKPQTPRDYMGPLNAFARAQGITPATVWWHRSRERGAAPFAYETGVQPWLCDAMRGPRPLGSPDYLGSVTYAYHTGAELFADLLAEHGRARRIHHVVDHITDVELDARGDIAAVHGRARGRIEADFFVDCTGFAALLIGKALQVPHVDFGQHLLCDRAVAIPVPRKPGDPRPYTTCTAETAGWRWEIDLAHRTGAGHVYSSAFTNEHDAEALLRERLGARAEGVPARHLRMRVGRREASWKNNCVAIGLSAGFLEPLESTGIYLIESGARLLADLFRVPRPDAAAVRHYNDTMRGQYEELRDFIVMHYCLTAREDTPFWREVRRPERIPDSLAARLELWREFMPAPDHLPRGLQLFEAQSYMAILYGLGGRPDRLSGRAGVREPTTLDAARQLVLAAKEQALQELPGHQQLIDDVVARFAKTHADPQPAPLALQAGVPLRGFACEPDRVRLSQGTAEPSAAGIDPGAYHAKALVPRGAWRAAAEGEWRLLAQPAGEGPLSFVAVVKVPEDIVATLRSLIPEGVGRQLERQQVLSASGVPAARPATSAAAARLVGRFARPGSGAKHLGLVVKPAGQPTTTGDKFDEKKIGLHFDSWSQMPAAQREDAPNRICVNLGTSPRRFLFVNLPMSGIRRSLEARALYREDMNPTDIGRLFMRAFPDYPVVSVEVRPGEAYIAPTENVIHDGSSESVSDYDLTFTSIGQFMPREGA